MKASFTSRITCSVLAATLAALPCNEALAASTAASTAAPPATPTATSTTTTSASTTTTTAPAVDGAAPTDAPLEGDPGRGVDGTTAITAPGETPTDVSGEAPPESETPEPPPPEVVAPPAPPPEPIGPERPPEPTVANGKYKAKGTGLMIAGGSLLGLGIAGLLTSYFLTRCDELENSFSCRNKQNSTFAVPATGAAALLGAVLLAVGVGYHVRYKKWQNWKPSATPANTAVYPTLLRGGAGLGYSLKF